MPDHVHKNRHDFDGPLLLPTTTGTVDRQVWIASGRPKFRDGGATVDVALLSEVGGGGLTQEQIEDFVALLIQDNADLDWTYTDGTPALVALIKANAVELANLATQAQATVIGVPAGAGTVTPSALSAAQLRTILGTLDADTLGGDSKATIKADVISTILGGVGAAYDTLSELLTLINSQTDATELLAALANRPRFAAGTVPNGASPQTITHSLGLANIHDFNIVIKDSSGGIVEYDVVGVAGGNTVTVTDATGTAIPTGLRYFITAGA